MYIFHLISETEHRNKDNRTILNATNKLYLYLEIKKVFVVLYLNTDNEVSYFIRCIYKIKY